MTEVSGTVDPALLLKRLGKAGEHVELWWWQFGQCSSKLCLPQPQQKEISECSRNGYVGDDGYSVYKGHCSYHGGRVGEDPMEAIEATPRGKICISPSRSCLPQTW
ncbi:hypothetical protein NMG60_11037349 [Bertholletia excelsa]